MKINEKNLCVFAKTPPFDMEGFLNKRGENSRAFQKRYFVLKGNLLFYFETRLEKEPQGLIIVEGCTIELSLESDVDNYCFEIAFNGTRTYVLAADTQESMEAWMKALTCAGYEYKRIIVAELQRQLQEIEESRNKMRIQSQDAANASGKPEPPPRRHNPFDRRAPPPPPVRPAPPPPDAATVASLNSGVIVSPMPFIAGHFGSSNAKAQQELLFLENGNSSSSSSSISNNNNSSQTTPRAPRRQATGASPSIFYSDLPVAANRATVLTSGSSTGSSNNNGHIDRLEQQRRQAKAAEKFRRHHERFREMIMPDIIAYRERRKQPLIQF